MYLVFYGFSFKPTSSSSITWTIQFSWEYVQKGGHKTLNKYKISFCYLNKSIHHVLYPDGHHFMGTTLWALLYVHYFMGTTLWAPLYGHHFMGTTLWAPLYGHHFMGTTLWALLYGHHFMGILLWALLYCHFSKNDLLIYAYLIQIN